MSSPLDPQHGTSEGIHSSESPEEYEKITTDCSPSASNQLKIVTGHETNLQFVPQQETCIFNSVADNMSASLVPQHESHSSSQSESPEVVNEPLIGCKSMPVSASVDVKGHKNASISDHVFCTWPDCPCQVSRRREYNNLVLAYLSNSDNSSTATRAGTDLHYNPRASLSNTVENSPTIPFIDPLEVIQCDSRGQIYHNPSHDIMIKFPERAIPEGETIKITIGVTLSGPFDLPEGTRPVSPIVQLCVQDRPHYRFLKQLEVMLPHYLDITNEEDCRLLQLGFMKAGHNLNPEGKYVFQKMDIENETVFKPQQKYATLLTDHFCFLCISSSVSSEATARATYCLISVLPNSTRCGSRDWTSAYFCVAYFLSTCSKVSSIQLIISANKFNVHFFLLAGC